MTLREGVIEAMDVNTLLCDCHTMEELHQANARKLDALCDYLTAHAGEWDQASKDARWFKGPFVDATDYLAILADTRRTEEER